MKEWSSKKLKEKSLDDKEMNARQENHNQGQAWKVMFTALVSIAKIFNWFYDEPHIIFLLDLRIHPPPMEGNIVPHSPTAGYISFLCGTEHLSVFSMLHVFFCLYCDIQTLTQHSVVHKRTVLLGKEGYCRAWTIWVDNGQLSLSRGCFCCDQARRRCRGVVLSQDDDDYDEMHNVQIMKCQTQLLPS